MIVVSRSWGVGIGWKTYECASERMDKVVKSFSGMPMLLMSPAELERGHSLYPGVWIGSVVGVSLYSLRDCCFRGWWARLRELGIDVLI